MNHISICRLSKQGFLNPVVQYSKLAYFRRSVRSIRIYITDDLTIGSLVVLGMMLLVFARQDLTPYISNIQAAHVGTGILGKMVSKTRGFGLVVSL